MKVAIFGASGLLGRALMREWRNDEVVGLTSRAADIRDRKAVDEVVSMLRPRWIVLSAAYADVDGCERDPELAFAVNRDGAVNVAEAAKKFDAKLLFLSSDYVFDGNQSTPYEIDAPRNPQSAYGKSKAEAEVRLIEAMPDCCIVRTSWLFGTGGKCFPDTILRLARERAVLDVVNDQRGCPTYTVDLAQAVVQLCRRDAAGIVHATNMRDCTWYEFACEIVKRAALTVEVRPVTSEQMARPAPRPKYSVLSGKSLREKGIALPIWPDALERYMTERAS